MEKRGSALIIVLAIVLIVLAGAGLWWVSAQKNRPLAVLSQTSNPSTSIVEFSTSTAPTIATQTVDYSSGPQGINPADATASSTATSSWIVFSSENGLSFQYPSNWAIHTSTYGNVILDAPDDTQLTKYPVYLELEITRPGKIEAGDDGNGIFVAGKGYVAYITFMSDQVVMNNGDDSGMGMPLTNEFVLNSSEYATAKQIVATANTSIIFNSIVPDANGISTLSYPNDFGTLRNPIHYPAGWISGCDYVVQAADPDTEGSYTCVISDSYDSYYPNYAAEIAGGNLLPLCEIDFSVDLYAQAVDIYEATSTYPQGSSMSMACQKAINAFESQPGITFQNY